MSVSTHNSDHSAFGVPRATSLQTASTTVTHQDQFICRHCQICFYDILKFLEHKSSHNPKPGCFLCYICKSSFKTEATLHAHYKDIHRFGTNLQQNRRANWMVSKNRSAQGRKAQSPRVLKLSLPKKLPNKIPKGEKVVILCVPPTTSGRGSKPVITKRGQQKRQDSVDIAHYDRDFLFQLGMKSNNGSTIKYMREVFVCLHCPSLEKASMDCLVSHMVDLHAEEIVDLCSSQDIGDTPVKEIPGTAATITSFKEYRAKCLAQKSQPGA